MGILNDISKKAQEYAGIAVDKAKDLAEVAADKAQTLSDTAKTNMAIMNEQRELEKNYRAIGEWFVAEHQSDVPDAVKDVVAAVNASKERIAQLEASKPRKDEPAVDESEVTFKVCPVCGAASDSKFCPPLRRAHGRVKYRKKRTAAGGPLLQALHKKEGPRGPSFYFSLGIFQPLWSVCSRWWDFSPSGAFRNSRYSACTSLFRWENRTLALLSMLHRISPRYAASSCPSCMGCPPPPAHPPGQAITSTKS